MSDDVHVDLSRPVHHSWPDALVEDAGPPRAARASDHQLGGIGRAGELQQGPRHIVAHHAVHAGADVGRKSSDPGHGRGGRTRQPVPAYHVHHHQFRARARGDAAGAAHQGLRLHPTGHGDDHPLPGLPGVGDLVLGPVLGQRGVDMVGQPQQRKLAQRREVARAKVVAQCRVDLFRCVDVSVRHSALQRLRCDVNQLDLGCAAHNQVWHGFALEHAGDLLDDVVEALQVLDVDGREHVDARREKLIHVLPAFGVRAARRVRVRELVYQHQLRCSRDHRGYVELVHRGAAVVDGPRWNPLDAVQHLAGSGAAVGFHHGRDHVGAAFQAAVRLAKHCVSLPDARSCAEIDPQLSVLVAAYPLLSAHRLIIHR